MTHPPPPDAAALADAAEGWAGAYLHIPFCARVCPYCDFAVVAGRDDVMGRYLDALVTEITAAERWRPLDAVFIGGGTPSRVAPADLGRVIRALADRHGLAPDAEVTMEANPEDWSPAAAEGYAAAGVTRVSFGVQSMDGSVLAALGRRHDTVQAADAVAAARRGGIGSVSVDLIFGQPLETAASWRATLDAVVALDPDHVSTYALTVERGTPLGRAVAAGAPAPDPDVQAERWETATAVLGDAGYVRYEVSNHARPGHVCRYNLGVWAGGEYLAHGLGAHGHRDGERFHNVRALDEYLRRVEATGSGMQSVEHADAWDREVERLFVGVRRSAGVRLGDGGTAFVASTDGERLLAAGVIGVEGDRLVVRRPLLTDLVARELLGVQPPDVGN